MTDDPTDRPMDGPDPLEYVPPPARLSPWRRLLSHLWGHCSYCGKRYRKCSDPAIGLFQPIPADGRCCPFSHEGYVDRFNVFSGLMREWSDNVKARRSGEAKP